MYRLLIVDPRPAACERLRNLLDWSRYGVASVTTATSYAEAMAQAVDLNPHIALINVQLGDQYGYDLVRHLRAAGLQTVFAMIADSENAAQMRKSMQAGARDYLLRPVKVQPLQEFLERTVVEDLHGALPQRAAQKKNTEPVLGLEFSALSHTTSKIILAVESGYHHSLSLTRIAEDFNMSSKYIGRVFLQDTGLRFTEYLMTYRMIEARRLIISTREKISVIARMVGYSQLNNFYIHFKKHFGVSPSALRRFDPESIPGPHEPVTPFQP